MRRILLISLLAGVFQGCLAQIDWTEEDDNGKIGYIADFPIYGAPAAAMEMADGRSDYPAGEIRCDRHCELSLPAERRTLLSETA